MLLHRILLAESTTGLQYYVMVIDHLISPSITEPSILQQEQVSLLLQASWGRVDKTQQELNHL
uniref:Uncharacterized protein n=1 Tax=Arundo donax TaxID=35708 RepID=A0A0A9BEW7_ARUDO